ncbi:MAG: type II toxin-antitoxin system death-on-curing family toxin [Deltaproteobacteria bacterium]|nr:type II toxin-antitoxin system death-on-curing family toxin [Deltaproteobacteria bacterium]
MRYLTPEQILFIHYRVMAKGGVHGVRDVALLESASSRPSGTFDGADLYDDIFLKAAALMQSIIKNHPFIDGNKRTAIAASSVFLAINGRRVTCSNKGLEKFTMKAASGRVDIAELSVWFRKNSE